MTREEAITALGDRNNLLWGMSKEEQKYYSEALDMAIASLKTDEVYQLEYENRDFVEIHKGMTNGEVIQALFPNVVIRNDDSMLIKEVLFTNEMWNSPYQKGGE